MQIALLPIPKTPFHATKIKLLQQMRRLTCLFYKNSLGFFCSRSDSRCVAFTQINLETWHFKVEWDFFY